MRTGLTIALLTLALVGAACGGGSDASNGGGPKGAGGGALLVATSEGLFERDPGSSESVPLIAPEVRSTFILDPAVSPNGESVAYIEQPPPAVSDGRYDAGSNLMIADRNGENRRMLFEHEQPNQLVRFPRWLDDSTVFAIVQEIREEDGVSRVVYTLQRFDAGSGEREVVLEDVLQFDISPDGQRIVYAKLSFEGGETLEVVDIDGRSNARTIVPVEEQVAPFNTPRFSPDGSRIAFAAADQTLAPPVPTAPTGYRPVALRASFDGLPQDIWVVAPEGGRPQVVAELKEDLPSLTWDGTGDYIYVLGVAGLHEVNVENGAVQNLGPGVFHGQVTWAPGR